MKVRFLRAITAKNLLIGAAAALWSTNTVVAQPDPASPERTPVVRPESGLPTPPGEKLTPRASAEEAQRLYAEGLRKYGDGQWLEALDAFNASVKLRAHPLTLYNLGLCHRSMSHYVQARLVLEQALALNARYPRSLSAREAQELHTLIKDSDRMIARVSVNVAPADTTIAVDGRPLQGLPGKDHDPLQLIAGASPFGPGAVVPQSRFVVLVDPGARFFTLTKPGFQSVQESFQFGPGEQKELELKLDQLPAHLGITADSVGAIAKIEGGNLGAVLSPTPTRIQAAAGSYRVVVQKKGFIDYKAQISVEPGQHSDLRATLHPYKAPLYKRWWFWTGATALAGGIVGLTLGLALPPPPYQNGSTGWLVQTLRGAR